MKNKNNETRCVIRFCKALPWCLFYNFLISPLNGTLSLIQPKCVTVFVSYNLWIKNASERQVYTFLKSCMRALLILNSNGTINQVGKTNCWKWTDEEWPKTVSITLHRSYLGPLRPSGCLIFIPDSGIWILLCVSLSHQLSVWMLFFLVRYLTG